MNAERQIVVVARVLLPAGRDRLAERYELREGGLDATREDLLATGSRAPALWSPTRASPSTPSVLDAGGEGLRVVANFAVGYDNVDLEACRERGVVVTNTPDVLTEATAELAMALTLAAARRMSDAERDLRAGHWRGWDPAAYRGIEISGSTVGRRRDGQDRPSLCRAGSRPRRRDRLRGPEREARGGERAGRPPPRPGGAARGRRRRQPARTGDARDEGVDRRRRAGADRPARGTGQHLAGTSGGLGGRRRGARGRDARAPPAWTSTRTSPRSHRGCCRRRAACSSRTSARRRCRRATGWRARSPTT